MEKLLSILISGKNDNFRGNTSQLLKFNLEKTVKNIKGFSDVELVLCDWGSEKKIVDDIFTTKSENFKCVYVPPEVAEKYNNGASYAYIHPHNTAARHSSGKYIILWDTDTILLNRDFKKLYSFVKELDKNNNTNTFYWASRCDVEYHKYKDLKTSNQLEKYLYKNAIPPSPIFYNGSFGGHAVSLLLSKSMWEDSTGFWEKLVHRGWADIELHNRLLEKYIFGGNLSDFGIDFYHLLCDEIYKNTKVLVNPHMNSPEFACNPPNWGLLGEKVEILN